MNYELILDLLPTIIPATIVIVTYLLQRKKYRLIYTIPFDYNGFDNRDYLLKKFDYKVDENEKRHGFLRIRIMNYGNQPIKGTDFETPIIIKFDEDTEITKVEYLNCYPKYFNLNISYTDKIIEIGPFLLNAKESFDIEISMEYLKPNFSFSERIENISEIEFFKKPVFTKYIRFTWMVFIFIGLLISYIFNQFYNEINQMEFVISLIFTSIFTIVAIINTKFFKNYDRLYF